MSIEWIDIFETLSPGDVMDLPVSEGVFQLRNIHFLRELPATLSMEKEEEVIIDIGPFRMKRSVESLSVFSSLGDVLLDEVSSAHLYSQLTSEEEGFMSNHLAPEDFLYVMERSEAKSCPAPDYDDFTGESEKF